MNIKEVFEKCNDDDYVVDNNNVKWRVSKNIDKGDLIRDCCFIANFYHLTEIFDLDFKKVYDID